MPGIIGVGEFYSFFANRAQTVGIFNNCYYKIITVDTYLVDIDTFSITGMNIA